VLEVPEAELAEHADVGQVFMNVNTPEELELARALLERGR
jgi:molybdopterin-guanine dinucleotide biosynthesis protein A